MWIHFTNCVPRETDIQNYHTDGGTELKGKTPSLTPNLWWTSKLKDWSVTEVSDGLGDHLISSIVNGLRKATQRQKLDSGASGVVPHRTQSYAQYLSNFSQILVKFNNMSSLYVLGFMNPNDWRGVAILFSNPLFIRLNLHSLPKTWAMLLILRKITFRILDWIFAFCFDTCRFMTKKPRLKVWHSKDFLSLSCTWKWYKKHMKKEKENIPKPRRCS